MFYNNSRHIICIFQWRLDQSDCAGFITGYSNHGSGCMVFLLASWVLQVPTSSMVIGLAHLCRDGCYWRIGIPTDIQFRLLCEWLFVGDWCKVCYLRYVYYVDSNWTISISCLLICWWLGEPMEHIGLGLYWCAQLSLNLVKSFKPRTSRSQRRCMFCHVGFSMWISSKKFRRFFWHIWH